MQKCITWIGKAFSIPLGQHRSGVASTAMASDNKLRFRPSVSESAQRGVRRRNGSEKTPKLGEHELGDVQKG